MIDLTAVKKNKFALTDYNYQRDIDNRLLLARFSELDRAVLEEILFSPIRTQIRKMAKNLDTAEDLLIPVLEKLTHTGLLTIEQDTVVVDKEVRKYFEVEIEKFEDGFIPGMEFLQHLLKKVPIHVLPIWYSIPRTSNNIFDSLVEKYLHTPQIFQRHLLDMNLGNPVIAAIAQEVFRSPDLEVSATLLLKKFEISQEQFEEYMLILELHFVCCLRYQKSGDQWEERVTPFQEWREYLTFLKTTTTAAVEEPSKVTRLRPHDFSFVEDMSAVLQLLKKQPVALNPKGLALMAQRIPEIPEGDAYLDQILHKLQLLKLAELEGDKLQAAPAAAEWLEMRLENRALYLYRHPANKIRSMPQITEKVIREAEKSILRVLHSGWVLFDEFIQGVIVPIGDQPVVSLKKSGKSWKYARPDYTAEERVLLHDIVFEWLFETGSVAIGTYQGKECFTVTAFGQSLFG